MAKPPLPLAMAEHEAIGKVRKAAVDSNNAVTVAVLTNITDLERSDLLVMERDVVKQNPPPWALPSKHSLEDIQCLECWRIGAACRPFAIFDFEVEVIKHERGKRFYLHSRRS